MTKSKGVGVAKSAALLCVPLLAFAVAPALRKAVEDAKAARVVAKAQAVRAAALREKARAQQAEAAAQREGAQKKKAARQKRHKAAQEATQQLGVLTYYFGLVEPTLDAAQLRRLIALGANVNAPSADGDAPLHHLVADGDRDSSPLVSILLDHGARINARAGNGDTPLLRAVSHENVPATRVLLARSADVRLSNWQPGEIDSGEATPLLVAQERLRVIEAAGDEDHVAQDIREIIQMLKAAGARE